MVAEVCCRMLREVRSSCSRRGGVGSIRVVGCTCTYCTRKQIEVTPAASVPVKQRYSATSKQYRFR